MKVRIGFVSNSSSSSFVLCGYKVTLDEIDPKGFNGGKVEYMAELVNVDWGGEGQPWVVISNNKVLEYVKSHNPDKYIGGVYRVLASAYDGQDVEIPRNVKIPKGKKIVMTGFTIDQHTPETIEDVREVYEDLEEYAPPEPKTAVRLEMKEDDHYKFYQMTDNGDGTFTAHYGRIGTAGQTKLYPISDWDKIYAEKKFQKHYEDVSYKLRGY